MLKKEKNRKIMIIVTTVLLALLVVVGIVMLLTQGDKKEKPNEKDKEDFRCVGDLCISKVSVEEVEGVKSIFLSLKNEGTETINKQCVKLSSGEQSFNFCPSELAAGDELALSFEYAEGFGTKIEDFRLEKGVEEGSTTEEDVTDTTVTE